MLERRFGSLESYELRFRVAPPTGDKPVDAVDSVGDESSRN
jgi:hypothetical protein